MSSISNCARCGENHDDIEWKALTRAIPENDGSILWTHWYPCPTNGEPILCATIPTEQAERYVSEMTISD